jgi:hypothetical protein
VKYFERNVDCTQATKLLAGSESGLVSQREKERERKREKERERERKREKEREKERERERKSDNQQALHRSLVHTLITWCPTELVREHGWVNVIVRRGVNEVGDGTVASVTMCGDEAVSKPVDEQSTA